MNHSVKVGALEEGFLIEFLKNSILQQREDSAEKMCQIVIISHNSSYEKLKIKNLYSLLHREAPKFLNL